MTSLRQPVGVWHEIVIQARGDTTCLSMDSIFSLAFCAWTFYVLSISAVNKTVVHIAFKCIAWSFCLCVNRPIWRKRQQNQIKSYRIIRVRLQISLRCQQSHSTLNNRQSLAQSLQVTTQNRHDASSSRNVPILAVWLHLCLYAYAVDPVQPIGPETCLFAAKSSAFVPPKSCVRR